MNICIWISTIISLKFFLRVQSTIFQHYFRQWLGTNQTPSHYLNTWWLDYIKLLGSLEVLRHFVIITIRLLLFSCNTYCIMFYPVLSLAGSRYVAANNLTKHYLLHDSTIIFEKSVHTKYIHTYKILHRIRVMLSMRSNNTSLWWLGGVGRDLKINTTTLIDLISSGVSRSPHGKNIFTNVNIVHMIITLPHLLPGLCENIW